MLAAGSPRARRRRPQRSISTAAAGGEQRARLGHRRRVALELAGSATKEAAAEEATRGGRSSGLAAGARRPPHLDSGDSERAARTCSAGPPGRALGRRGRARVKAGVGEPNPAPRAAWSLESHSLVSPSHLVPSHPTLFFSVLQGVPILICGSPVMYSTPEVSDRGLIYSNTVFKFPLFEMSVQTGHGSLLHSV